VNARERSRSETRRRLIEKGMELFSDQGVVSTRASDIAQAAGVAVGTLYLHFGDKSGLLRAILFEGVNELLTTLQRLADNPVEELSNSVREYTEIMVGFAEEHPMLCRILFDPECARTQVSSEIHEYLVTMQEKRLREGIEHGLFSQELDPTVAAHAVVGMFVRVLDWWTRNYDKASREAVIETLTRLRLSGLYSK
jgi:AcrR family transcriptional regulator